MNMYTVIVIVAIASTTVLGHSHGHHCEELKKNATECKPTVQATDDDMKLVLKHVTPSSKTGQCLVACILKKKGWMNQNKINVDAAKQSFANMTGDKKEKMMEKLTKCQAQGTSETDECVVASKFTECVFPMKKNCSGPKAEEYKKAAAECKASVKATDDDMKLVMVHATPSTRPGQCLLACISKKIGWMNADNTINTDVANKFFEAMKDKKPKKYDMMVKKLQTCKTQEKPQTDECLAAKNFSECMTPSNKN